MILALIKNHGGYEMNDYLTREIWKMRKKIKGSVNDPPVSLLRVEGNVYQLLFLSQGCDKACTFCNYGFDYNLTLEMIKPLLEEIKLEEIEINELELEANGSFLSEREIPYDLFLETLKFVANKGVRTIMMETHYTTINEEKLKDIRKILGDEQDICFEVGFESAQNDVRDIYNKDINIDDFIKIAYLCEKYNIDFVVNVLLGAPFLSREEQIQDCLNSFEFIFRELPKNTRAVLFPINIKNYTMLEHWQKIGKYQLISLWELVELLHRTPTEYLDKITIAWWGNRENAYTNSQIPFPRTCRKCRDRLMKFCSDFYSCSDTKKRIEMIEDIWNTRCECDR